MRMAPLKVYVMWTLVAAALWMCGDVVAKRKSPKLKEKSGRKEGPCPVNWTTPDFRWKWATLRNSTVELQRAVNGSRVYEIREDVRWKACEKDLFQKIPCRRFRRKLAERLHRFQTAFTLVRAAFQIEAVYMNLTLDKLADLLLDKQMPKNVISSLDQNCRQNLTDADNKDEQKVIFETLLEGFHTAMEDLDKNRTGKRRRGDNRRKGQQRKQ